MTLVWSGYARVAVNAGGVRALFGQRGVEGGRLETGGRRVRLWRLELS